MKQFVHVKNSGTVICINLIICYTFAILIFSNIILLNLAILPSPTTNFTVYLKSSIVETKLVYTQVFQVQFPNLSMTSF